MRILFALITLGVIAGSALPTSTKAADEPASGQVKVLPTSTKAADAPASGQIKVSVVAVDVNDGKLGLGFAAPIGQRGLPVDDAAARTRLAQVQVGDVVEIEVDQIDNPQHIKRLVTISRPVSAWCRLLALGIGLSIVFVAAFIVVWLINRLGKIGKKKLRDFVVGMDGRYSNSKCQLVLWFSTVMMVYLATVMLRVHVWGLDFLYGAGIPANLLALTGLSALTFGGAKAITTTKVDNAAKDAINKTTDAVKAGAQANAALAHKAQAVTAQAPKEVIDAHQAVVDVATDTARNLTANAAAAGNPKPPAQSDLLTDLVLNDKGEPDIGDFQMIFLALLAVVTFAIAGYNFLGTIAQSAQVTLPDVDTTLLSVFGVGQGAYLIKKMASKPGEG
jgi:hypothetical protein